MKKGFSIHPGVAGAALCLLTVLWPAHPAQSITENYSTTLDVLERITVTKQEDLHFGTIGSKVGFVNLAGGFVTITPDRTSFGTSGTQTGKFTGTCGFSGVFSTACVSNDFWQGRFRLTGTANEFYTATLPSSNTVAGFLLADQFRGMSHTWGVLSSGTTVTGRFDGSGVDFVWVGARLDFDSGLPDGNFISFFNITVNYL